MRRDGWKGTTLKGKQVTYTCYERTAQLADITAQVEGKEHFYVQLDAPFPIIHEQVEARVASELEDD